MRTQSSSSLSTYLKCNLAYKLSYIDDFKGKANEKMRFGSFIEDQLFLKDPHSSSIDYVEAFDSFLGEDEVTETQREISLKTEKYSYRGFIDCVTKANKFLEIKVSSSPYYYLNQHSFQIKFYSLMAKMFGAKLFYLIFERNKTNENFKGLHVNQVVTTALEDVQTLKIFNQISKQIENDQDFVPSLNGCSMCLFNQNCEHYFK